MLSAAMAAAGSFQPLLAAADRIHMYVPLLLADNESLAARVAGQALSKADVNRMVAER
jgi:hypothetical protein